MPVPPISVSLCASAIAFDSSRETSRCRAARCPPTEQIGVPVAYRDLKPADVAAAAEIFLTSTSPCLLPVTRFEGRPIGTGQPGPMFHRLLSAWSQLVGLDIAAQSRRFAVRKQ